MQTKIKFPSKRLLLLIFLSGISVILLESFDLPENTSFLFNLLTLLCGFSITALFFIPSVIIKNRTDLDFMSLAHIKTPNAMIFVSAFYCMYFVFTAEYFLIRYCDMFSKKLNSEANILAVAFVLLAVCVYAAYKGTNGIARCSIFVFVFSFIVFLIVFAGNISNLEINNTEFNFYGQKNDFINNTSFFLTPAFTAVIFSVLSGYTKNFRSRQIVFSVAVTAIVYGLILFFTTFVLGEYAFAQDYRCFLLSKTTHFGNVGGFDSLYLSISLLTVFLLISLILTCICKSTGKSSYLPIVLVFSVIIFVLFICAYHFNAVKELLTNHYILNILTFISAVVIPVIYLFAFGRRLND
ncbi:GerAB/ArcD/ProY family transporter [Ruminococcus sp.]|uniref:GerAB/ArcD/ProY family transporter n=1 Tax=Ruminococcus sp. TaxID=41978 RepID=UPI003F0C892E